MDRICKLLGLNAPDLILNPNLNADANLPSPADEDYRRRTIDNPEWRELACRMAELGLPPRPTEDQKSESGG